MGLFHKGQLHSGKSGKVVTDPEQAKAIALSACGESKYSEVLQSMGFPSEVAEEVVAIFAEGFLKKSKSSVSSSSFDEMNWQKSFDTGKAPAKQNPENYHTGEVYTRSPANARISKTGVKGDDGKRKVNDEASMIAGPSLPKGPGNPQAGSSKEVYGMRALG
jgi:hypothetical protein